MTTILQAMEDRSIKPYDLAKSLGGNPQSEMGNLMKKLRGERGVSAEELHQYCQIISQLSGKKLVPADLQLINKRILIK